VRRVSVPAVSTPIASITIVGTGRTATGIAAACAAAGAQVRVAGRSAERAGRVADAAAALAGRHVASAGLGPAAFADADMVLETVVEDLATKRDVLGRVEAWATPVSILATNTSSLSLRELGARLARPEAFLGMHFLHPADLTAVVEVVRGPATSASAVARVCELAARMGKQPLVVQHDIPGFIWNRIQFAVLRECLHLLDEGIAGIEAIDAAVSDGLAPRWVGGGPFLTADLGGLGTFVRAAAQLFPTLASDREVPARLASREAHGDTFYAWDEASLARAVEFRRRLLADQRAHVEERRSLTPPAAAEP